MTTFWLDGSDTLEQEFPYRFADEVPIVVGDTIVMLVIPTKHKYTSHFKSMRPLVLERDGHQCRECGKHENLHIHHITYQNEGSELLDDLITLCGSCHGRVQND